MNRIVVPLALTVVAVAAGVVLFAMRPSPGPRTEPADGSTARAPRLIEKQANVFTYNRQEDPSLDIDADGNVLVVWGSRRQEANTFGVFGRLFDADGVEVVGEIHVNQTMPSSQEWPTVACAPDGRAWVAWQSLGQDGSAGAIVTRRFGIVDDTFTALTDEIVVNEITADDQVQPAVAVSGGRVLLVWTTLLDGRQIVAGRLLEETGQGATNEFRLSDTDDVHEWLPAVAAQPDGNFVIAWASRTLEGTPVGIFYRRVGPDGTFLTDVTAAADSGSRQDVEPSIDTDAAGHFVIAWMGLADEARGYDVFVRRFDVTGRPRAEPVRAARTSNHGEHGWLSGVAVASAPDGRFVAAYNADDVATDDDGATTTVTNIYAQRFTADGAPDGEMFRVNEKTDGNQALNIGSNVRRVAWRRGRLAFAWHGDTAEDGSGIGLTILFPDGPPPDTGDNDDG